MALQPGNPAVGGVVLRIPAIQSPNFVAGTSGWAIFQNGAAEFHNLTISGGSVIISGAGKGVFVYSGPPALGNLIVSMASLAGTDAYGNAYPQGFGVSAGVIPGTLIAANTITAAQIAAGTITATEIAAGAVTATKIAAGAIDGMTITGALLVSHGSAGEVLIYSGTPALGNLIASIAATGGTDAYGNAYLAGIASYDNVNHFKAQIVSGGFVVDNGTDQWFLEAEAGADIFTMFSQNGSAAVSIDNAAIRITGPLVADSPSVPGTAETWHIVRTVLGFAANWAAGDAGGVFRELLYRKNALGDLELKGSMHMTLAAGIAAGTYTVNTAMLAAAYRPNLNWRLPAAIHTSSANVIKGAAMISITTAGAIQITTSVAIAQNDNFYVATQIPIAS